MMLQGKTVFHKLWFFLVTYVLTLKRFDLFLQGALLIVILLETNVYLLLKRDATQGYHTMLVEEWVMVGAAGVEVALGAAVAWFGRGRRQFALSSWLGVTSACGLLVLAFPFAVSVPANVGWVTDGAAGVGQNCSGTITELCGAATGLSSTVDNNITGRTVMLVLTVLLCTLTKVSIWSHGLTYLDDHDPQNGPYFYGILISIRLSLGLSGNNWLRPGSVREDWWEAHLSLCMLTLMFAVLFTLFPTRMKDCVEQEDRTINTGFAASLGRIVRNKALWLQTLGLSFLSAAVFCFVHYDRAYVQAKFHVETIRQDPRTSRTLSDIFRSLVIIFFVMIFRVRFSARRSDGVKASTASRVAAVVAIFVAVFFIVITVISCDTGDVAGVTDGVYNHPNCSKSCGCNLKTSGFSPVCAIDSSTTYFSPCTAGCSACEDLNGFQLFHDCSCGTGTQRAVRGACALLSCRFAFSAYQVFYTMMLAVSAACFLMQGMVVIRAVHPADKAIAVGGSFAVVALLAFVLGNLLYMIISYLTCAYSYDALCLLNNPSIWTAAATSALLALLAAAASIMASRAPGALPEPTTEL
ncbi:solute carrier organic anion transporter family member 2A1-like [Anticarsia gemmatalis]|uniref:solute carrier organic anion transporter family member 2A1-like n=1 Tax=Anticarsia gemmatalis TaxID=129554 RepID=UPI003F765995